MSAADVLLTLAAVGVFCVIVVAANYADRERSARMRRSVIVALLLLNGLILLVYGVFQVTSAYGANGATSEGAPTQSAAWGALVGAAILAGLSSAVLSLPVRERLARFFPVAGKQKRGDLPPSARPAAGFAVPQPDPGGTPIFPQMLNYYTTGANPDAAGQAVWSSEPDSVVSDPNQRGFNPQSTVHMVAIVLVLYLIGITALNFILGGGLSGVAESYSAGLSVGELGLNLLPEVVIPVLGVGWGLRRGARQVFQRLGLGVPSLEGLAAALAATIGLFVFVAVMTAAWQALVSEETFQEQTEASDALSESVDSIALAFLLAASAAIGEEIAFRGALQPIFGFWPTALVFALTHIQYTLTPAWLIILGVAIVFGWLRMRYNTTVSMLTHFMYNFIPLALTVALPEEMLEALLHLF